VYSFGYFVSFAPVDCRENSIKYIGARLRNYLMPPVYLALPFGVTTSEFQEDLYRHKTRLSWLSCSVVCVTLRLAVSVETDLRQTDRQIHHDSIYRASVALRDKIRTYPPQLINQSITNLYNTVRRGLQSGIGRVQYRQGDKV